MARCGLRGTRPRCRQFRPHPEGFADSCALIEALANRGDFKIRVGAYPEPHPEATSDQADVDWLKRKFDAGADEAITQFFFEADTFLRFRDRCAKAGITKPILPGILPIENWQSTRRFATACGASIPGWLDSAFSTAERDDRCELLATAVATELCSKLIDEGVEHLHFYTAQPSRADARHLPRPRRHPTGGPAPRCMISARNSATRELSGAGPRPAPVPKTPDDQYAPYCPFA